MSGPTCALYVGTTMVKTDFPCGGYSDELHYRSTNYKFTEEPGHYDVGICSLPCKLTDETVARTTFDVLAVVPDLADLTRAQAQDSLTKATLTLGGTLSPRSAQPDWQVIGQRPKAGSMLKARSTVSITLGPPADPDHRDPDYHDPDHDDADDPHHDHPFDPDHRSDPDSRPHSAHRLRSRRPPICA